MVKLGNLVKQLNSKLVILGDVLCLHHCLHAVKRSLSKTSKIYSAFVVILIPQF